MDGAAAGMWAVYATMLGYLGGATFQHSVWKPLAVALGIGAVAGLALEGYRRVQRRRGKDILGADVEGGKTGKAA